MDNSTQRKCGALLGLALFTVAGCYFSEDTDGGTVEGVDLPNGTGATFGQLATVGATGMDPGGGAGDADGAQTAGIPGGITKTGDDDGELDDEISDAWSDDSSGFDASSSGSSTFDDSGTASEGADSISADSGSTGGNDSMDSEESTDGADEESGMDSTDSGDPPCEFPWPACTMWHKPSRDFWYGFACIPEQILLPTNKAGMVEGDLVCETHPDSTLGDKDLIGAWRVLDQYEGNMWRRDGAGVCLEFEPAELPPMYPFHYELDGAGLNQFELDTLVVCP